MKTLIMRDEEARNSWNAIIDTAFQGGEVVIQRYDKPVAVLVNYDVWQTWKAQRNAFLDAQAAEIDAGHFMTQEQVEEDLRRLGTID